MVGPCCRCVNHPEDIVLTRHDYLTYRDSRESLGAIVQSHLFTLKMLFVGFSLTDPNFHVIVSTASCSSSASQFCFHAILYCAQVKKARQPAGTSSIGVSIQTVRNKLQQEIWDTDITFINMVDPIDRDEDKKIDSNNRRRVGLRRLEIFLDYIMWKACDRSSFLFDQSLNTVAGQDEKQNTKEQKAMQKMHEVSIRS